MISPVTCLDLSCPSAVSTGPAGCTSTPCYRTSKKKKRGGGIIYQTVCLHSALRSKLILSTQLSVAHSLITSDLYLLPLSFHQVAPSLNESIKLMFLLCCNWGKFVSCDNGCTNKIDLTTADSCWVVHSNKHSWLYLQARTCLSLHFSSH